MKLEIHAPGGCITELDVDNIRRCPYCGSNNVDNACAAEFFDDSAYFDHACKSCDGAWTLVCTVDRILLHAPLG